MREQIYISILIAGFGGGVVRGLGRIYQTIFVQKTVISDSLYFWGMVFLSSVVGLLTAVVTKELGINSNGLSNFTPALSFIVGYAGGDFLENLYKIILKKPSLYEVPTGVK